MPAPAAAQEVMAGRGAVGPGTVVGVVVDTAGRPLDGAEVFFDSRRRQATTGPDGRFLFDGVRNDSVTITTRRIGYYPQSRRIAVGDQGASVRFELVPRVTSLPAVVTEAELSGLSGVVSDTGLRPLAGARVQALGGGRSVTTDSAGMFQVPLRPGRYVLRVSLPDHRSETIGVTIPSRGGRRVAVQLTPGRNFYHAREAAYASDLQDRLTRRSSTWSRVFTREDIAAMNVADLSALASIGAVAAVDPECNAIVNGGITVVPLWAIDPGELEFLEVYARMPATGVQGRRPRGVTSINGSRGIPTQGSAGRASTYNPPGSRCGGSVFVWTRR